MNSYLKLFLFFLISTSLYAQDNKSLVAQIGKDKITAKEFITRYELSPYLPEYRNIDPDSIKYDFLYSMIAERLWANEAERLGLGSKEKFSFYFKPLEEMFVRDALFKKEIKDKIRLSADDINSAIMKSQFKLHTQVLSSPDSNNIFSFFKSLESTTNIDSLLSITKNIHTNNMEVFLGSLKDEEIEDSLYSLKVNQFTSPIKSEIGWVIFRIKDKVLTPVDLTDKKFIDNMEKTIKDRRIQRRYQEYLKELLTGIKINISPDLFKELYYKIWDKIKNKKSINDTTRFFELDEPDMESILSSTTQSKLGSALFTIDKSPVTLHDFLSQLTFEGFNTDMLDSMVVLTKLNKRVKQFVEEKLITKEGYKQQLNFNSDVRNDLAQWRQQYLAQLYFNTILDSIQLSEDEVYNYYLNNYMKSSSMALINIRLISTKNLDEVSKILESLKQGRDFSEITKEYGKTDSLVNSNGETGLKPALLLGYVGSVASDLKLNEVYGPIRRNNAYTILQVVEKKEANDSLKLSFNQIKDQIKSEMRWAELKEKLNKITAKLAENNNVKIYSNVINQIKKTDIPMFVHRLMGFGGRIAGVPLVTPFSGWVKEMNKNALLP